MDDGEQFVMITGIQWMPVFWLDDVQCSTEDRYLSECGHNGWRNTRCSHVEDAGVNCTGPAGVLQEK